MKRYITLLPALLATVIGTAQVINDTINRMVLVESTYNPIIAGAVKRNFLPEEVKPTMNREQVIYADENVDLTNFVREALPARLADVITEKGVPGYAHLGYGNYNNLSGLAAYKWGLTDNSSLAVNTHVDGWNGKFKLDDGTKWRSRFYDMGANADYQVLLGGVALNAGVHATYYNYNYLMPTPTNGATDTQSANDLGAYVGVKGSVRDNYVYWANVSYTRFGRSTHFAQKTPHSEGHLCSEASLSMDLYDWGMATVQVKSDVLTYQGLTNLYNYHSLGITPQWSYRYKDFRFVGGLNMDFLAGKHVMHHLQLSPECSVSYMPDQPFTINLVLDGGRDINTFGHLQALSPYWASKEQLRPTYTFLNAHLNGNVRIMEGLHFHVGGGYKILSDALLETRMDSVGTTYTGITNHNAQVASVDAGISYSFKDLVTVEAKGGYNHWMLKGDQALLARTPKLNADIDARVRVRPDLHTYTHLKMMTFTGADERAVVDWSLGAQYNLNKRFTLFLDMHNLLNHRHQYFTGYPAQGFNMLLGAMVKF